ncbi:MAG TPA: amidase [Solirubrobacteraceae bacterium]|nr:amidase [Solirubrobacteraceae bacterium]
MTDELWGQTATALAARIRAREVSAAEVMRAHLARIDAVNPDLNAIVTLDREGALAGADAADRRLASGEPVGPLHGLPVAVKDLEDTAGMRTTYGSAVFRDHVPAADTLLVTRLRAAGAIVIGKTNTPEFGAGSQTFNAVFGVTRNPFDRSRTPGGSSGGAAAAVASGMLPLADGSDLGASVRNPAAFCGLVGLRPSPGRIPAVPATSPWSPLSVHGPIARTVEDAALLLRALCGPDPRAPLSLDDPPAAFADVGPADPGAVRIAWSDDLGDLPVEPAITAALRRRRGELEALGCTIEDVDLDLRDADEAFETLRAIGFAQAFAELLRTRREELKDTVVWNIEAGLALTGEQVARALTLQATVFARMRELLERYDAFALPVTQVLAFDVDEPWPRAIAGVEMGSYLEWMRSCSRITVTAHPAMSVPAAFTPDGLPIGLQLVGRHRGEAALLRLAAALHPGWRPPIL